jgi:hypothetical protein
MPKTKCNKFLDPDYLLINGKNCPKVWVVLELRRQIRWPPYAAITRGAVAPSFCEIGKFDISVKSLSSFSTRVKRNSDIGAELPFLRST